ncbi:hypothetical protein C0991_005075 [Blastosporella zonata]|nr:hypothetical protein C0991_005075 [Blastosporella zonata]
MAFKLVVILDLKRRDNERKVLAVKVQIQSMMSVLLQLRDIEDPNKIGPDGLSLPGRLETLMEEIAKYIEECASACDFYLKKSLIPIILISMPRPGKYVKSVIYETRFAKYAAQFSEYEVQLQHALTVTTAVGVDALNQKMDDQATRLQEIQAQMTKLFAHLDSPVEKEIRSILERGGGALSSIADNQVLQDLMEKSGEGASKSTSLFEKDKLVAMRQSLHKELTEDIESALQQNLVLFKGKLDIQKRELDTIKWQNDRILSYVSGGHERIIDPQIREIWKEMGWKSTVKARHFVLALRDHFLNDRSMRHPMSAGTASSHSQQEVLISVVSSSADSTAPSRFTDDEWAHSYVNVSYLQALSESIDDDGSGLINIQEINTFTTLCPKGWSLLQWLAYWAAGWHSSISIYSKKIYRILKKLYKLRQKVRPDNLKFLDFHLQDGKFYRLELLLRSTKAMPEGLIVPELAKLRDEFCAEEERRIHDNLQKISYTIDSTATVSLVTGPGRIERYIYPLLYLVLKHQVKIVQLARSHIFHPKEFPKSLEALDSIFSSFDTRLRDLSAIFRQMHVNPEHQFENFAFGMFQTSYGSVPWVIVGNSLFSVWNSLDIERGEDDDVINCPSDVPLDILTFGPQEPLSYPKLVPFDITEGVDDSHNILLGAWAGYCMWSLMDGNSTSYQGLFRLELGDLVGEGGSISGTANGYLGSLELTGLLTTIAEGAEVKHVVDLIMTYDDGQWIRCTGVIDPSTAKFSGDWYCPDYVRELRPSLGSNKDDRCDGSFEFSRTPAPLVRFKYSQDEFKKNRAQARWRFACAAVRFRVKRDMLSSDYVVERLRTGRRFKELTIKNLIETFNLTRRNTFPEEERQELRNLESTICPTLDQFYYSIARYVLERLPYHL